MKTLWQHLNPARRSDAHAHDLLVSLFVMAFTVESRDPYTGGHLWRVSQYARMLAEKLTLGSRDVGLATLGGFLHDLGKVGVPDAILTKPGALTGPELAIIRTHPDIGARLLADHPLAALVRDSVEFHHERPDGTGYPHGLTRQEIPWQARLVGVADAFDAMTSHRPYRPGMPLDTALRILDAGRGSQFDADCVAAFRDLPRERLTLVQGHSDDGIPLRDCPMCGPTLVVRREQRPGELVYCRNCSGEFELARDGGVRPTGASGSAAMLEPEPDLPLMRALVRAAGRQLPPVAATA